MNKSKILIVVLSLLLFSCSSSLKITTDYDSSVDFNVYKTYSLYGWAEDSDALLNPFDKKRIETTFATEFEKRGVSYVEEGGDIVISLFIVTESKTSTTAYTNHYGTGGYYYGSPWGWGMGYSNTTYHDYDYKVGTLICDVFDGKEKKLIWQGVAAGTIEDNPEARQKIIVRAVNGIMYKYPVRPGKK